MCLTVQKNDLIGFNYVFFLMMSFLAMMAMRGTAAECAELALAAAPEELEVPDPIN